MKRIEINRALNEMQNRQMGYVAVMSYAYCNLCVKGDASSLLSVEVVSSGMPLNIEDMADVYVHNLKEDGDEVSIDLFPKKVEYIGLLAQGILKEHPEMKQSFETYPGVEEEDKDDINAKFLRLTMPEVDKDRYKLLNDAIDGLNEKCKVKLDALKVEYKAKLIKLGAVPPVAKAGEEMAKEAAMQAADKSTDGAAGAASGMVSPEKDSEKKSKAPENPFDVLDAQCEQYDQMRESLTNEKKTEVEEAYQHYLLNQEHAGKSSDAKGEKKDSFMSNVGQQLKMD